jgi:hypothetical protein
MATGDVYARVEKTCPGPPPAVTSAEFSELYESCMASGLKACLVISHAAGCQAITVSCSLPVPAMTATTAGKAAAVVDGVIELLPLRVKLRHHNPLR